MIDVVLTILCWLMVAFGVFVLAHVLALAVAVSL